jgi:hypothetical protein
LRPVWEKEREGSVALTRREVAQNGSERAAARRRGDDLPESGDGGGQSGGDGRVGGQVKKRG